MKLSLERSLLFGLAGVLLISLVPAGVWLDGALARELEARAREDLARAPMRLKDRNAARSDALMMHAQEVARLPGLADALRRGDRAAAMEILDGAAIPAGEAPVLVDGEGEIWVGVRPTASLLAEVQSGAMPVGFVAGTDGLHTVSLAPVKEGGAMWGAAGVSDQMGEATAGTLSALTAADVVLADAGGAVLAATLAPDSAAVLAARGDAWLSDDVVHETTVDGARYWVIASPLGGVAHAIFAVDASAALAVLPRLRRGALAAGVLALLLALGLGAVVAMRLARPVDSLARAADRLAEGDFDAPLPSSAILEVERVTKAFERMRGTLASRLRQLGEANRELEDRQRRLHALQAEMIQRDRLAAAGRLVTELAHEIRNPVANIRNCLEVVHRRLEDEPELRDFTDLAIDELLRMHELAEQMLDLNRPIDPGGEHCDVRAVTERAATVLDAGDRGARWPTRVEGSDTPPAGIGPDTLKQVLLGLVQNAREAMQEGGAITLRVDHDEETVTVDVLDEGPGIPDDVLPHVFDPFYTTKEGVQGVGLGLFIAEGLVRRTGGRLTAYNRDGGGAGFRIQVPRHDRDRAGTAVDGEPAVAAGGTGGTG